MPFILRKSFLNFFGLDLKSSDLSRREGFATGMMNAQYTKNGSLEKRPGYQAISASAGGHGITTYRRVNTTTGAVEEEVISVSNKLHKLLTTTLNIDYVGSASFATVTIFYDTVTSQYRCRLLNGTATDLDQALGLGFDEASTYTCGQLRTAIDALTDWTCSIVGDTNTPAAFLRVTRDFDMVTGNPTFSVSANYWSDVNTTVSTPFVGSETNKNSVNFENVSFSQLNNVIYITNGYDEVQKYDGQTVFRAGISAGVQPTTALGGAGLPNGTYNYGQTYVQIDAQGNVVEGNISIDSAAQPPVNQIVNVTVTNIQAGSGFNTNCALVNGNQVGVNTITVTNTPHTMKPGDTAYFLDRSSGLYVTRTVSSVTPTTVVVSGAAVNVNNADVISNNLRIAIWRNVNGSTTKYLVAEIPNNSFAATQVYADNTADATLDDNEEFIEPLKDRSPPPKGKYVSAFGNQLVIAGNLLAPTALYYSDIDGAEYFPSDDNQFVVQSALNDRITGIAANNEVFCVFKQKSIHIISGNIAEDNIRVDQLTSDIGCAASASIQEVRGSLYFMSDRGVFRMVGGQIPEPIGELIEPVWSQIGATSTTRLQLLRAVAVNDRDAQKYILFMPAESADASSNLYANSNSRLFVYDYSRIFAENNSRGAWLEWSNMNIAGGATIYNQELVWSERRLSTFTTTVDHILYRKMQLGDVFDYMDHNQAVNWSYKPQWDFLGEPGYWKKWNRIKLHPLEELANNEFAVTISLEGNFNEGTTVATVNADLSDVGGGYGVSAYGTAPYGDPDDGSFESKLGPGKYRSFRPVFSNSTAQQNVQITGWEFEVAGNYDAQIKE